MASNPGDRVAAIINGRRRWLTIVGIALSPEYVYAIRPGEIFPDKRQFGIFWMGRRALGVGVQHGRRLQRRVDRDRRAAPTPPTSSPGSTG